MSQHKVTIRVEPVPPAAPETIFIAGDFNNWNPGDPAFRLQKDDSGYNIQLALKPGKHEFKFTGGSWATVEVNADGSDLRNRELDVSNDLHAVFSITGWKHTSDKPQNNRTVSQNVSVLDTGFYIPQLKRNRRIWIYLPADYSDSKKYYPVLYMHDGQNLFDEQTSFSGEWGVDETLDELRANCIVIGIDNSSTRRLNEYNVNTLPKYGRGEGRKYLDFIVNTLKPAVDKKFRTLPGRQSTFMAGSSMGGLITLYGGLYYPEIFGGLGIFSPAFSLAPQLPEQAERLMKKPGRPAQKFFFYSGGAEGETMVSQTLNMFQVIHRYNRTGMKAIIRSEGQHNEARWRAEFPEFYRWMIGSYE